MHPLLIWHISKIIVDSLFNFVVIACVLNQSRNHWLLSNALQSAITMCFKFKEEITNPSALVSLIDDDFGIAYELSLFVSNIKKDVFGVFYSFLSFLKKIEKRIVHNMLSLMLNLKP